MQVVAVIKMEKEVFHGSLCKGRKRVRKRKMFSQSADWLWVYKNVESFFSLLPFSVVIGFAHDRCNEFSLLALSFGPQKPPALFAYVCVFSGVQLFSFLSPRPIKPSPPTFSPRLCGKIARKALYSLHSIHSRLVHEKSQLNTEPSSHLQEEKRQKQEEE